MHYAVTVEHVETLVVLDEDFARTNGWRQATASACGPGRPFDFPWAWRNGPRRRRNWGRDRVQVQRKDADPSAAAVGPRRGSPSGPGRRIPGRRSCGRPPQPRRRSRTRRRRSHAACRWRGRSACRHRRRSPPQTRAGSTPLWWYENSGCRRRSLLESRFSPGNVMRCLLRGLHSPRGILAATTSRCYHTYRVRRITNRRATATRRKTEGCPRREGWWPGACGRTRPGRVAGPCCAARRRRSGRTSATSLRLACAARGPCGSRPITRKGPELRERRGQEATALGLASS
jgi:hypothetical protein